MCYHRPMCGRYAQTGKARRKALTLAEEMQRELRWQAEVRGETWNLAPSTPSLAVRSTDAGLTADWLNWGFTGGAVAQLKTINARIESVDIKPMFREAWATRRCLVPVDGWYEWRMEDSRKQPYYFRRRDGDALWFAGLWTAATFCLFTAAADGELATIHHRRPLTVQDAHAPGWLTDAVPAPETAILHAVPPDAIEFYPVSQRVGNPRSDGPDLVAPLPPPDQPLLFDLS